MNKEELIDFEQLWDSGTKCRKGVGWKPSVKSFTLNQFERTLKLEAKLKNGTWRDSKPRPIKILYPKKRDGSSIPFEDRVYQRSINDNALYPEVTKHFIYDNCACQKGKGPDFAVNKLKRDLHNFVMKNGLTGWVIQIDIHGYYPNMNHKAVESVFKKYLEPDVYEMIVNILACQYEGDVGYNPGSQMIQIAGISLLDRIDHMCKEELHMRFYRRYMDDSLDICLDKEIAERNLNRIIAEYTKLGFVVNEKKTHITKLRKGFTFLGFNWKVTETAKVILTATGPNVHHERKKLYRLVNKLAETDNRAKGDECYESWKSYISKANTWQLKQRMDLYYSNLWREIRENYKVRDAYSEREGTRESVS